MREEHPRRPPRRRTSTPCSPARPAAPPSAQRIRTILHDTSVTNLSHRAEALLTAADRAQHIDEVVAPALDRRPPRGQRPQRLLHPRLPGLRARPAARRGPPDQRVGRATRCWPDLVLLLDAAAGGARAADARPPARSLRAGGRRASTTASATASAPWPRPSPSGGSSSTARPASTMWPPAIRARRHRTAGHLMFAEYACRCGTASSGSRSAVDQLTRAATASGARLPVRRPTRVAPRTRRRGPSPRCC